MNDTEQRIAIAKARGWDFDPPEAREWKSRGKFVSGPGGVPSLVFAHSIPEYPTDLNACADFEKTLTDDQLKSYDGWLIAIAGARARRATAKERCDAFCLTLGIMKP